MAHKELKYDQEARSALESGVDSVANAVKVTLGPKGRYVVLAQKIVHDGLKNVAAGANPLGLRRGIEKAVDSVVEHIREQSAEISGKDQIARVAAISAADDEIGDVIADAIDKVGKDGVVN